MDSSKATNTGFIDQLGQQQELNPASSEDASTSFDNGFQKFLTDPVSDMPFFPDSFGPDFTNADSLGQLPANGQVELDENFGIDFMAEDFSWMNQHDFTTTNVVSQQAEVQPGANTTWPSAPFEVDQSGLHFAHQEMPEVPQMGEMPFYCMNMQFPTNQPVEGSPGATHIPVSAGKPAILQPCLQARLVSPCQGHSLHVQRGNRYHCLFQSCSRSFTRLPDLFRHQTAYHLQGTSFWCGHAGCERASPYGRPFPRKDKRTEHERKIHGIEYAHHGGQ